MNRMFLSLLGLTSRVETARARAALAAPRKSAEKSASTTIEARVKKVSEARTGARGVHLGAVDDTPYRLDAKSLFTLSSWLVAASGSGKSRLLVHLILDALTLTDRGFPSSVALIDLKGDVSSLVRRRIAARLATEPALGEWARTKLHVLRPFAPDFLVPLSLGAAGAGALPPETQGHLLATSLLASLDDGAIGQRQKALATTLLAAAVEQSLTLPALPWVLGNPGALFELAEKSRHPRLARDLRRLSRESPGTVEGLSSRISMLLRSPGLGACLSAPTGFDWRKSFEPGSLTIVDVGDPPVGSAEAARFVAEFALSALVDAGFDPKRPRGHLLKVVDEPHAFVRPGSVSALQLERVVSRGRSLGISTLLSHQAIGQLPKELRESLDANAGLRMFGSLARADAEASFELLEGLLGEPDQAGAARRNDRRNELANRMRNLGGRRFVVVERGQDAVATEIEVPNVTAPREQDIAAEHRATVNRGASGVPRGELERQAEALEAKLAARYGRRTERPASTDAPKQRRQDPELRRRERKGGGVP